MKKSHKTLLYCALSLFMGGLTACDDVKEGDRYIDMGTVTAERAVLLEDFTGQECLNCPIAHETIDGLIEQYGADHVVAVSIHSGPLSIYINRTNFETGFIGLMNRQGETIKNSYGISSFPMGVINFGSPTTYDNWATEVRNAIAIPTDIKLNLEASYTPDEKDGENGYFGTINMKASILAGEAKNVNVQFWIVEDGIQARQKLPDGSYNEKYVHNNVFRAQVFDSMEGNSVTLTKNMAMDVTGNIVTHWDKKEHWELENLGVIAIVSDASGVLQVKRVPLFPKADNNE
ncbi:MAG: Omp28 family outer membrane lipoprotein [Candidatus Amulumruptor caecigallinarius]|nr:Omp28 family outer membrane lipoprotein [Candidatus Amulumruptor caecigallinarius]